jgi:hypothetical protein
MQVRVDKAPTHRGRHAHEPGREPGREPREHAAPPVENSYRRASFSVVSPACGATSCGSVGTRP